MYDNEVDSVQWRSHVDLEVFRKNVRKGVKQVEVSLKAKKRSCLTVRMTRELWCKRERKIGWKCGDMGLLYSGRGLWNGHQSITAQWAKHFKVSGFEVEH